MFSSNAEIEKHPKAHASAVLKEHIPFGKKPDSIFPAGFSLVTLSAWPLPILIFPSALHLPERPSHLHCVLSLCWVDSSFSLVGSVAGLGRGECACMLIHLVTSVQSCPTLCDSMDYSPPGSSVHGDAPGKNTEVDYHALLQGIFPTQGSNPGLPHCMWILYQLSYQGCYSFIPENVLVLLYYM